MRPASLTRRLIWTLTLGATLLWLAAVLLALVTLRAQLDEAFDGGLRETAERLLPLAVDGFRESIGEADADAPGHEVPLLEGGGAETVVYQLRTSSGAVVLRSHDAPLTPLDARLADGLSDSAGWRVFTLATPARDVFIQVAERSERRTQSLAASLVTLLLPLFAFVPLAAVGIFLAVRRGLRPVANFAADICQREAANLAPIEPAGLPAELQPIARAVDALMLRLRAAFDAERDFAANSAHELRTPIAGSLAQTQRLVEELEGHPAQPRARAVEESLQRLRQLGEKLLQLARADAGIAAAARSVDLLPALRAVVDDARRALPAPDRLRLAVAPGAGLAAAVDVDAFGIALRNLIDNALLHGAADVGVDVAVPAAGVVEISNGGPPVAPATMATLTRRFARGRTNAAGSGLGLAIVDAIARQSGMQLELLSPAPGRADGFCARLTLPRH